MLDKGCFKIKEWTCSERTRRCGTDADVEQKAIQLLSNSSVTTNSTERVLGMWWDPQNDTFGYKVKINFSIKRRKVHLEPDLSREQVPTSVPAPLSKRQVLSQVNGVYDPLGLISPFTVRAKMMLRKLWGQDERLDWDDAIPDHLGHDWITFFEELFQLKNASIPRCIKPRKSVEELEFILFSDPSNEAYGAAAYVRWTLLNGTFAAQLIPSKNRIAPVKIIDIVRLELAGAFLSKRLRTPTLK